MTIKIDMETQQKRKKLGDFGIKPTNVGYRGSQSREALPLPRNPERHAARLGKSTLSLLSR